MTFVNAALGRVFDGLLLPFRGLPPAVTLVVVSLAAALGMLWVFKRTSNQRKIALVKSRIQAGIFEIRLFGDDPVAILRAQLDVLRHNAAYFALSLVPLAWMVVPFVLVIAQLQARFGYGGFAPGDETTVTARLDPEWRADFAGIEPGGRPPIALEAPPGVEVRTPTLWFPSRNEAVWKVAVRERGEHRLVVRLGDAVHGKTLEAREGLRRRSPVRHAGMLWDQVLWPAERPLPQGPLAAIEVQCPDRGILLGMPRWLVVFFLLSIVFAFALKGRMGVTI